jgi:signal transduction histidine kinase
VSLVPPQDPLAVFFALAVFHALADFPLQGEYLARQKVRSTASGTAEWLVALAVHSLIHAGAVWLVTGSKALGLAELLLHALIDWGKGANRFGLLVDQGLHLACKLVYVAIIYLSH